MIDLPKLFDQHDSEYCEYSRVHPLAETQPILHALLMLYRLVPNKCCIFAGADHDIIYLNVDSDALSGVISEEEVIDLIRCGVHLENDRLCMHV